MRTLLDESSSSKARGPAGRHGLVGLVAAVTLWAGLAACAADDRATAPTTLSSVRLDLSFSGQGFDMHDGQTLHASVVARDTGRSLKADQTVVSGGAFAFRWPAVLARQGSYSIHYYVDINRNGECEPSDDHVWSATVQSNGDPVVLAVEHTTSFSPSACATFHEGDDDDGDDDNGDGDDRAEQKRALTFTGRGFTPHDGQVMSAVLVRSDERTGVKWARAVVSGGRFGFRWESALEPGESYRVDYFADIDGDGACDTQVDHMWRVFVPTVTGDVSITETHDLDFDRGACNLFSKLRE